MKVYSNYGFESLKVYQIAFQAAMEVFKISKQFLKEETYSLTDQVRRSSRAVCSNIAEGYRKRKYPKHFSSKMTDADSECSETIVWLNFARACGYVKSDSVSKIKEDYHEIGRMLSNMIENPDKFIPKKAA